MPNNEEILKNEVERLEKEKERWIKTDTRQRNKIREYESSITKLTELFQEKENLITGLEGQSEKDLATIQELIDMVKGLKETISTKEERINKLDKDIDDLTKENNRLKKIEKENYPKQIKDKEKIIHQMINKYKTLEDDYTNQENSFNETKKALLIEKKGNKDLRDRIEEMDEEANSKDSEITDLKQELKNTWKNNTSLRKIIDGKKEGTKWVSNKDTFIQIMKEKFSTERLRKKLGNYEENWLSDLAYEILSEKDKQRIGLLNEEEVIKDFERLKEIVQEVKNIISIK